MELLSLACCMFAPVAILGLLLGSLAVVLSFDSYRDLRRTRARQHETERPSAVPE